MKHILKLAIILFTFLYLVNFVSAEFAIQPGEDVISLCRCSTLEDSFQIKNTGSDKTTYTLLSNLKFVEIKDSKFSLAPGEIKEVGLLINSPCDSFTKTLKIEIKSDKGDNKEFTKEIIAGQCLNIDTKLYVDGEEVNPCKPVDYTISIENTGTFTETYTIISDLEEFINFSTTEVKLEADEKINVDAELLLTCDVYGETQVSFFVTAENNQLRAKLEHDLMINQYYGYTLDIEEDIELCEENFEPVQMVLENNVETPNYYYLELVGAPSFVKLSQNIFELEGNAVDYLNLTFDIKEGQHTGEYNFTIVSKTAYGDLSQEQEVTLKVSDCYNIEIEIMEKELEFCSQKKEIEVTVKNLGRNAETINFEISPDWMNLWRDTFYLESGDEGINKITMQPEDLDAEYELLITATLETGVSFSDHTTVKVVSQGTCNYVDIAKKKYSIRRDLQDNPIIELTNKGRNENTYKLELESEPWLELNQTRITLGSGETKSVAILSSHSDEIAFGDYPTNINIIMGDLVYSHELTVSLKDKPLCLKTYNYFSGKPCQLATIILVIGVFVILLFAVFLKKTPRKLKKIPFWISILIMLLLFIGLAFLVFIYTGPPHLHEPTDYSEENATHFIWLEGKQHQVEMDAFVSDPDSEDEVKLSLLRENEYVEMTVENRQIVFTPAEDWYGTTSVVLIATDDKGSFARSPAITLEVVHREKLTLFNVYSKICWYWNLLLVFLGFIFLTIIAWKKIRNPPMNKRVNKKVKKKKR
ncbi:MAG: hypothetical protein ABIB43_03105 [archaeon]